MGDKIKILSIDDEADIRYALKAIFDYQGWKSVLAADVEEGLIRFVEQQPDIVLIDYHLPKINGVEGVRRLRRLSESVPIIVFTIDENQEVANRFFEAGATDFALKPIKAPDLISRINLHIRLRQSEQANTSAQEPALAKGIGRPTLRLVVDYLQTCTDFVTVEQIAAATGLAYQTAYKYIQHMQSEKLVQVHSTYGKVGRPKQSYRCWQGNDIIKE